MKQYAILVINHSNNVAAVKLPVILLESDLPCRWFCLNDALVCGHSHENC